MGEQRGCACAGGADRAHAYLGDSHLRAQVHKLDDQSLSITLDSRGSTRIVVRPCDANGLRDLIWKHIFRKVFETTYAEVRWLGRGQRHAPTWMPPPRSARRTLRRSQRRWRRYG